MKLNTVERRGITTAAGVKGYGRMYRPSQVSMRIKGRVKDNTFYFPLNVNGEIVQDIVMDTGAFELMFNDKVAKRLGLPNLGDIRIEGVGGSTRGYLSECTLNIGGHVYRDVPCVVNPGFSRNGLFGLRFFIDNSLELTLNPVKKQLIIVQARRSRSQ